MSVREDCREDQELEEEEQPGRTSIPRQRSAGRRDLEHLEKTRSCIKRSGEQQKRRSHHEVLANQRTEQA